MAEIRVFTGGAPKPVFSALNAAFERQKGHRVEYTFAVMSTLQDKIAKGDVADVLVMPTNMLDGYEKQGIVKKDGRAVLGLVPINAVVADGTPKPDLTSADKVRETVLNSRAVVHATPGATPSGSHMGKLIESFGGAAAMKGKWLHKPALEGGVELVRSGEAEIGFYPKSEVMNVPGLVVVGPLPADVQLTTIYGAAISSTSKAPDAAAAFIAFMKDAGNQSVWTKSGFDLP